MKNPYSIYDALYGYYKSVYNFETVLKADLEETSRRIKKISGKIKTEAMAAEEEKEENS